MPFIKLLAEGHPCLFAFKLVFFVIIDYSWRLGTFYWCTLFLTFFQYYWCNRNKDRGSNFSDFLIHSLSASRLFAHFYMFTRAKRRQRITFANRPSGRHGSQLFKHLLLLGALVLQHWLSKCPHVTPEKGKQVGFVRTMRMYLNWRLYINTWNIDSLLLNYTFLVGKA